jgi:phospholipid/cholesterol/gamma-HCH transport system substrate-binding protein
MSKSRTEWKVGLFVLIGLVLGAWLIIQFNKSAGIATKTYRVFLTAPDVSGVIPGSSILMAGVRIGSVQDILLDTKNGRVTIVGRLLAKYDIYDDASFQIKSAGFLGDQYIGVAQGTSGKPIKDGATMPCSGSFDLQETAKTAHGLIQQATNIVGNLSNVVARLDQTLLSQEVLTNLAMTVTDARGVSSNALVVMSKLGHLLETNSPAINVAVGNVREFSEDLKGLGTDLRQLVATNRAQIDDSMHNIRRATERLDLVMKDVQDGKGSVGALLYDEKLATDLSLIASNIQVLSSNINSKGLWGVIKKPKQPKGSDK